MVIEFYKKLYKAEGCGKGNLNDWQFPTLSHSDRSWMNREITSEEVRRAVFQMGSDKAPGPDRYPPSFFQRCWNIVGVFVV